MLLFVTWQTPFSAVIFGLLAILDPGFRKNLSLAEGAGGQDVAQRESLYSGNIRAELVGDGGPMRHASFDLWEDSSPDRINS